MEWNRAKYVNDLSQFSALVKRYDTDRIFKNLDSILSVAQGKLNGAQGNILSVEANGIELILKKRIAGTIPSDLQSVTIFFESKSEFDLSIDIDVKDRILDTYNFQIGVKGINSKGEHHNAWHLDRDIRKPNSGRPRYDHPLYHFQPGGNKLEGKDIMGAVFIGAPRLPHPPMDVILGVHFILRNFCSTKDYPFFDKLFAKPDYQDIVKRAKERMFIPYFKAFSEGCTHEDYTMKNVFPMAV
ncbi:hypothetical protein ERW51_10310 [Aliivibrio finisterrensis]|uniref:hypothetical protein n=1 Tax=Aliivibrio finisterrensis TaxID=511998 RepID=UPI00101FFF5C|nr:hypothetical protein [Aliivibrio finisterrensis]RYU68090.1 hypothetical protein ERW54_10505 [Aliivibrio finisterrensis]RYU71758.1 hypothetical protein ERW51_10310 [Aliivibrio finisterrensis]RYU75433.1 hypothetical protein ERW48_09250 [Aliivibrio finisterrensis]